MRLKEIRPKHMRNASRVWIFERSGLGAAFCLVEHVSARVPREQYSKLNLQTCA
ncbi:hypothetical protein HMPREF9104_00201 [Lentilactobacillus kisonensis F0435]|uniref:Uncharacterized protein n=1 Tax=Lentilactobacillus kisonensis F0435 TaxID=797516 RepID=H1LC88_9LACO|nr:hypothetical protein HMPREF9104_00201 [Lentilactobacillus kisonensis F0435]